MDFETAGAQPLKKLINMLHNIEDQWPCFTLLLGAGASVESGVKTGTQLVADWRSQHHQAFGDGKILEQKHLEDQEWYQSPEEYSRLFESLYDTPSQRRDFIESVIGKCKPSWGYMYLVDLIAKNVFNTVFTTNFDDLLNEACYGFSSDVRPVVSSHEASIQSIRLSSKRPKIIKLHGDFLYDSIKNTSRELESLEANMKEKLREFSNEYGLIVVGYAGTDRSIMEALDSLLRNPRAFPHGVYWCLRSLDNLSKSVIELSRFANFNFVLIPGFDALMSELHKGLNLPTHPIIESPYEVTKARIESMLDGLNVGGDISPRLNEDISTMIDRLIKNEMPKIEIPFHLVAQGHFNAEQYDLGFEKLLKGMESSSSGTAFYQYLELYIEVSEKIKMHDKDKDVVKVFEKLPNKGLQGRVGILRNMNLTDLGLRCITARRFDLALELVSRDHGMMATMPDYRLINISQITVHRGAPLNDEEKLQMEKITAHSQEPAARFGAYCVLQNETAALQILLNHIDIEGARVFEFPIKYFRSLPIVDLLVSHRSLLDNLCRETPINLQPLLDICKPFEADIVEVPSRIDD